MTAYVSFDVDIRDMTRYRGIKSIRDECSSARLVGVEGLCA